MKDEEKRILWLERIEAYRSNELSAASWCEQNQVSLYTFRYWISKFNKESIFSSGTIQWISVKVCEKTPWSEFPRGIRV